MDLKFPLYLCSQSPRRKKLLSEAKIPFHTVSCNIDENFPPELPYRTIPIYIAQKKWTYYQKIISHQPALILTADTMVFLDEKPLGKPKDKEEAIHFLKKLSGRTHSVISAFCLGTSNLNYPLITRTTESLVTFRELSQDEINAYVDTGSSFDKAGGYGYQDDQGKLFVAKIDGLESNVIGLPIELIIEELTHFKQK